MLKSVMVRLKLAGTLVAPELAWTRTLVLTAGLQLVPGYNDRLEEFVPQAGISFADNEKP